MMECLRQPNQSRNPDGDASCTVLLSDWCTSVPGVPFNESFIPGVEGGFLA